MFYFFVVMFPTYYKIEKTEMNWQKVIYDGVLCNFAAA